MAHASLAAERVLAYHARTMHLATGAEGVVFARGPGLLDWANQPNPFRHFRPRNALPSEAVSRVILPLPEHFVRHEGSFERRSWNTSGLLSERDKIPFSSLISEPLTAAPLSPESVSRFLFYAMSLSARKKAGRSEWTLRCNPSSGNLHPLETYLLTSFPLAGESGCKVEEAERFTGLEAIDTKSIHDSDHLTTSRHASLFHYEADSHSLAVRATGRLNFSTPASEFPSTLGGQPLLVGVSSVHWRELWKYGPRGFRYCLLDAGHALAAMQFSAALLGWSVRVLPGPTERAEQLLGLDRFADFVSEEQEEPMFVAEVSPRIGWVDEGNGKALHLDSRPFPKWDSTPVTWGIAKRLSTRHREWPEVDEVSSNSRETSPNVCETCILPGANGLLTSKLVKINLGKPTAEEVQEPPATVVLRKRRSAVSMQPGGLPRQDFVALLAQLHATSHTNACHVFFFVHDVESFDNGIYVLLRQNTKDEAQAEIRHAQLKFLWRQEMDELPFYCLARTNVRSIASSMACGQSIAGDGCYSVAIVAPRLNERVKECPAVYRTAHSDAGVVSHLIYLASTASGLTRSDRMASTGIGCFFDDLVHETLGLDNSSWKCLYMTAVGVAAPDSRLQELPAYG